MMCFVGLRSPNWKSLHDQIVKNRSPPRPDFLMCCLRQILVIYELLSRMNYAYDLQILLYIQN